MDKVGTSGFNPCVAYTLLLKQSGGILNAGVKFSNLKYVYQVGIISVQYRTQSWPD